MTDFVFWQARPNGKSPLQMANFSENREYLVRNPPTTVLTQKQKCAMEFRIEWWVSCRDLSR
jgi:hypothetical protein